jgi:methylated-DNA-protein-cysteine methyltransferase related protein
MEDLVKKNYKQEVLNILLEIPKEKVVSYGYVGSKVGLSGFFVGKILSSLTYEESKDTNWFKVVRKDGYVSSLKLGEKGKIQIKLLIESGIQFQDNRNTIVQKNYFLL